MHLHNLLILHTKFYSNLYYNASENSLLIMTSKLVIWLGCVIPSWRFGFSCSLYFTKPKKKKRLLPVSVSVSIKGLIICLLSLLKGWLASSKLASNHQAIYLYSLSKRTSTSSPSCYVTSHAFHARLRGRNNPLS